MPDHLALARRIVLNGHLYTPTQRMFAFAVLKTAQGLPARQSRPRTAA